MRQNHCSEISGSIRSPERCENGTVCGIGLLAPQRPLLAQRRHHRLAGLGDGHAAEALRGGVGDAPVLADHRDLLEPVLAADLEVVGVVAGGDLERAGAELGVDVLVGDHRQPAADQRQHRVLADHVAVAVVVGVDRDRGVGQHRLGRRRTVDAPASRRPPPPSSSG